MAYFKVTKEMLKNAITYMPLSVKKDVSKQIAELCLVDIDTDKQNKIGESLISLPHLKGEDLALKSIFMLNTLIGFYLDQDMPETDENGEEFDAFERYDEYAGGHLLNQIERFKSDPEVKDIVFDLMSDYKEFKKMVDTELYNMKANANDPIPRFSATVAVLGAPETMATIIEEIKKVGEGRSEEMQKLKEQMAERIEQREKEQ